ncbi:MAG: tetratricopeptide repeat protein [Oscillospiraceae bacterium]|nr:tetratricopeptide repeat protein [Oscillospiraceae bacterium]
MLKSESRRKEITARLSLLTYYIKLCNKQGLTDANKEAEDFFCGLLNLILGTSLGNMNRIQQDYPAIDLGDPEEALAIQVTSTNNHKKIQHTLDEFFAHDQDQSYNQLIVLIIGEKLQYRKKFQTKRRFRFDPDKDIWDTAMLCDEIMQLPDEKQEEVIRYLEARMVIPETDARQSGPEPVAGEKKLRNYLPDTLGAAGFLGREEELEQLAQALGRHDNPIFITGLGGIGKTELAIRFCQEQQEAFKVHFVRFSGTFRQTVSLGIAPGVENLWLSESRPEDQIYNEVMKVLEDCDSKTILIVDNADPADGNFDSLKDDTYRALCRMDLRLIITTRAMVRGGVEVTPMEMDQLLAIMHKYGQTRDEELIPLIEAVNRHTLTVDLMARTLDESWDEVTPAMLLDALRNSTLPEADYPEVTTDHNRDEGQLRIYAHLRSLFNVVQMDEDSRIALGCATLLPEGGMETSLFRQNLPAGARNAVRTLDKRGFLRREARIVTIHPVIRLVARYELKPSDESCREFLETLWGKYDKKKYDHDQYTRMAELFAVATQRLEDAQGDWADHSRKLWHEVGQSATALTLCEKVLKIREENLPSNDPRLAAVYNNLGHIHNDLGHLQLSLQLLQKALEIRQEVLDEDDPDLAMSYNNVGCASSALGDHRRALEFKEKAMGIRERVLPADDLDLAMSYNNVGLSYGNLGDRKKELDYLEKAMMIRKKVLPADHPDLAMSYNNIGSTYSDLGDHKKALDYYQKALVIREKVLPADHPDLATSYNNMGFTCGNMGDHKQQLEYQKKAMRIREKALPADHPDIATSYNNVGFAYDGLGNKQKALEYYEKGLAIRERILPANHPDLARSYNNVGGVYFDLADYRKALVYHEKAIEIRKKALPADHPDLATSYEWLGSIYGSLKNYSLAVEYLVKALCIREARLPPGHLDTKNTKDWLAYYHRKLDQTRWMDQVNRAQKPEQEEP